MQLWYINLMHNAVSSIGRDFAFTEWREHSVDRVFQCDVKGMEVVLLSNPALYSHILQSY